MARPTNAERDAKAKAKADAEVTEQVVKVVKKDAPKVPYWKARANK